MPGGAGEGDTLRTRTLEEIKKVKWDPAWGEERLSNMIETRPDWCISRQRVWGVPIAVFLCEGCGKPLNDKPSIGRSSNSCAVGGGRMVHTRVRHRFSLPGRSVRTAAATKFEKETDIFDVWLESGASYLALVADEPELSLAVGSLSRRWRPISRMVPVFPALRHGHARDAAVQRRGHARMDARRKRPGHVEVAGQ